ncbi:MAG: VCBS repeat-containing protein [Chitinophagales bacterium]
MNYKKLLFSTAFLFITLACNENIIQSEKQLFTLLSSAKTGVSFNNQLTETAELNIFNYDYFNIGSGVAIGDINNDNLPDILFLGNQVDNKLYLNKGNMQFEDITKKAGLSKKGVHWSSGATMADVNGDGLLDIYVCNSGLVPAIENLSNFLYINNGDLTFTESAEKFGLGEPAFSTQSSFFDYDKDGDLDMFLINHAMFQDLIFEDDNSTEEQMIQGYLKKEETWKLIRHKLYRNENNAFFKDVSKEANLYAEKQLKYGYGLGLLTVDFDKDGWVDIYVANDFQIPDFLYLNNGDGTFREQAKQALKHTPYYSMGCDAADIDNDAWLDLATVDMQPANIQKQKISMNSMNIERFHRYVDKNGYNYQYMYNALQINNGNGTFSEVAHATNLATTDWSWTAMFADFDNDGWQDWFVTNGVYRDTKHNDLRNDLRKRDAKEERLEGKERLEWLQKFKPIKVPNYVYQNKGNYNFVDKTADWGMKQASLSNGAAYSDLDGDGDLDVVVNNIAQEAFIYENNATNIGENNFLKLELIGETKQNNGENAKVTLFFDGKKQYKEMTTTRGYMSSIDHSLHFGLGKNAKIDSLKIEWLSGKIQVLQNIKVNQILKLVEKNAKPKTKNKPNSKMFETVNANDFDIDFRHQENIFDDFEKEILLPHRQSTSGTHIAVGDVNADLLEDFYIGGAKGQKGILYLQQENGSFVMSQNSVFETDKKSEDIGSIFFDFDGDKDLDLYVVSGGGGDFAINSPDLQDRLYRNDGKGNFEKTTSILPKITASGSVVRAADYDKDGDIDLFVGGRIVPGRYPLKARSYLLRNDNGKFVDVTLNTANELFEKGLVTDACWVDFDKDKLLDLVVVGEWLPIGLYRNNGQDFENVTKKYGLENTVGWWFSVAAADMDNDGDMDLVAGNIGENNKFNISENKPFDIYCNDFDANGTLDIVLGISFENALYPVRGRQCSSQQMPFITEKFPTYTAFAHADLAEIYGKDKLKKAIHYRATEAKSLYLENMNGEKYNAHRLPKLAQFAPINTIVIDDFDKDGKKDIVVAGNMWQTEVETTRYDAGTGLYLRGNGKGNFQTAKVHESGLYLAKDVKNMQAIRLKNNSETAILVANNNDTLQIVKINHSFAPKK